MEDIEVARSYPTPFANSSLLPLLLLTLAVQKHYPKTQRYFRKEYDYVIVGAGSAGAAVASRLSEMPCVSVLLLEAGKAPPRLTDVPAFAAAFYGSDVDWSYFTVPQNYTARAYSSNKIFSPRGKMLGGTSSLNGNEYVRGNRKDYDDWAAGGAVGWSYDEVLPYFKKMEGNVDPELVANGYHGVGGPLTVTTSDYKADIIAPLLEGYKDMGLNKVDFNGPTQIGVNSPQETVRIGQRCGTAKAYLVPRENAPNLHIVDKAFVTKVDIKNRRATGVRFDIGKRSYRVKARREVILSAGVFNTPQLLMLSGIGPAEHLNKFRIPVLADLPVGYNLQDQTTAVMPFEQNNSTVPFDEKMKDENSLIEYIFKRTGPLTLNGGVIMQSFDNSGSSNSSEDFPHVQVIFAEGSAKGMKGAFKPEVYDQVYGPYENSTIAICIAVALHPKTRGSIKLQSANAYDPPIIDFQYLQDSFDLDQLVEGMKLCHRIVKSEPMLRAGCKPFSSLFPGCEDLASDEDLYFRCVARLIGSAGWHQVGTAKMGDRQDKTTVVDPQLRVKNIVGLRVVDASVMPKVTSGNTNVPTIMIAEKAADMIKRTIKC